MTPLYISTLGSIYKFVVNLILPNILPTKKGICFVEKKKFFFLVRKKKDDLLSQ
jgi:hypothetical protein